MTAQANLPIAVETIVASVEAAAAIMTAVGNTEHAVHGAHRAADTSADCAANHAADRTGNPVTLVGSLLGAANDALRMPELGDREQDERQSGDGKIESHGQRFR